jgi:hypothetical protein
MARNGTILSCGCEPPACPMAPGSMFRLGATLEYWFKLGLVEAHTLFSPRGIGLRHVAVRGNLAGGEGHSLNASALAQRKPRPLMDGDAAAKVGQGESRLTIASVGGANQVKERVVLRDGNQRPIAERPACRRKIATEHPYLAYERT